MTKATFQIHYRIKSDFDPALLQQIEALVKAGIDAIIINPSQYKISVDQGRQIKQFCGAFTTIIVEEDYDYARAIGADTLLLLTLDESIIDLSIAYPDLTVAGMANTLSACKNWELSRATHIEFRPDFHEEQSPFALGAELYQNVIPKKMEYGWMIMSLNTPVFASQLKSFDEVSELVENTIISGIVISHFFEPKMNLVSAVKGIRELVK